VTALPRAILHVDMDAFFAAIVQRDNPGLRGKPVLTGGAGKRGVVSTASYEARPYGCRSAQPMAVALRLCPHAVVVSPDGAAIREASDTVMRILHDFSPVVQPLSVDEAFVDVTGSVPLFGDPVSIARRIRERIREETRGLTGSVGVAPNKFLAKLASDMDKPDGLTVIEPGRVQEILDPLPIERMWGVGPAGVARFHRLGVRTFADLRALPLQALVARFGTEFGEHCWRLARGIDDRPVRPDREAKSISQEQTFGEDLTDPEEVLGVIAGQAEQVARRLRKAGRFARTVQIKVRYGDFETITRAHTLPAPTDATAEIKSAARDLFRAWAKNFRPVRLIGVGVHQLGEPLAQLGLFGEHDDSKRRALDAATDRIAEKFGRAAIGSARAVSGRARTFRKKSSDNPATDPFGP